jgi:hypothetical protein
MYDNVGVVNNFLAPICAAQRHKGASVWRGRSQGPRRRRGSSQTLDAGLATPILGRRNEAERVSAELRSLAEWVVVSALTTKTLSCIAN